MPLTVDLGYVLSLILVGFCSGLGSTLGSYLANEHMIKKLQHSEPNQKGK